MIKTKNIYYMLAYAYQNLNQAGMRDLETEEFDNIHDLMAAIMVRGISQQVKRGLHRDYICQIETLASLRGKIDISESIKELTILKRQMVCSYDVFSENTLLNKILKTTMLLLLCCGNIKQENREALRKLLFYFEGVGELNPYLVNWSSINYHRNNSTYELLINICLLVIKGLLITTTNGQRKLAEFLDDQNLHRLYEKFVLGYFKREYPQFSPCASWIDWNVDDGNKAFLPVMKSDITLTNGLNTLIIDTKYYGRTMQANPFYDKYSVISGNLYQIFTYVKNKDRTGSGNVSGLLLYAKTDEDITPDFDYMICGSHISVKTLDLNRDWHEIEGQLMSFANRLDNAS